MMRRINSVGGMNKTNRLSQGAKKVTPPSIPNFNPRGSGSSFGSDYSYERDDPAAFSRDPSGGGGASSIHQANQRTNYPNSRSQTTKRSGLQSSSGARQETAIVHAMDDQGIDMTLSPGRDSPGDDSSVSIGTVESSSASSGYRNSTTSLDSGRASNSNSTAAATTTDISSFHAIQPIFEHRALVSVHPHRPTGSGGGAVPSRLHQNHAFHNNLPSSTSSFRQSYHSSMSSIGSADRAEDSICAMNIPEMLANGVHDQEILLAWLTDLHYEEYYELFVNAGYDMPTVSRMTPEDLTAIGIKKPNHRKRLKAEITRLNIPDGLPDFVPTTLEEWLFHIRLEEYCEELRSQGYVTIDDVIQISIEDLEDVGLYKLGHQKRFLLATKRIKDLKSGRRIPQYPRSLPSPPSNVHHSQTTFCQQQQPNLLIRKPPPSPDSTASVGYSSFQQQQQCSNLVLPNDVHGPPPAAALGKPVYRPEVIRIERSAAVNPLQTVRGSSPLSSSSPPSMPRPMPPLNPTYDRFQNQQRCFQEFMSDGRQWAATDMARSFDDGDVMLNGGGGDAHPTMRNNVALNAAVMNNGGGGTLPRPKGLVRPRPVAKIPASPQRSMVPEEVQEDIKKPFSSSQRSLAVVEQTLEEVPNVGFAEVPFANDNVGTIRMRSQLSTEANAWYDGMTAADADRGPQAVANGSKVVAAGQQRSTGDVLNDIGSMLADLTDELDAMLHMGREDPSNH